MTTWLHDQRLEAVLTAVRASGAGSVLDLGCGDGDLFLRLAQEAGIERLVGLDISAAALASLRQRLHRRPPKVPVIELRHASMTDADPRLAGFDCAVLVETIEHIDPGRLSQLERAVFGTMRPRTAIVTTPNAEFNPLLGVPPHRFRHPDHKFEWRRSQFRDWTSRITAAWGYSAEVSDIAGLHPDHGGASQMAVLRRRDLRTGAD